MVFRVIRFCSGTCQADSRIDCKTVCGFTDDQVLGWNGVKLSYLLTEYDFSDDKLLAWNGFGFKLTFLLTVFTSDQVFEWNTSS